MEQLTQERGEWSQHCLELQQLIDHHHHAVADLMALHPPTLRPQHQVSVAPLALVAAQAGQQGPGGDRDYMQIGRIGEDKYMNRCDH